MTIVDVSSSLYADIIKSGRKHISYDQLVAIYILESRQTDAPESQTLKFGQYPRYPYQRAQGLSIRRRRILSILRQHHLRCTGQRPSQSFSMAPYPEISSYPPLSQITVLDDLPDEISFNVLIEWHKARPQYAFEVELCYTDATSKQHRGQWTTMSLQRSDSLPSLVRKPDDEYQDRCYVGVLNTKSIPTVPGAASKHMLFTLKYRVDPLSAWKWIEIPGGFLTGELLLSSSHSEAQPHMSGLRRAGTGSQSTST